MAWRVCLASIWMTDIQTAYMVMFGKHTDTIRHFKSADDTYDFIVEIVRKLSKFTTSLSERNGFKCKLLTEAPTCMRFTLTSTKFPKDLSKLE